MLQSFVLLTSEAKEKYMEYIKGLLVMSGDMFHIPKKALDELAKENEKVAALKDIMKKTRKRKTR